MTRLMLGAAIGSCVHVAGLSHFLDLAREEGFETRSLGAAVPLERLIESVSAMQPSVVALSYRLTPSVAVGLFRDLRRLIHEHGLEGTRFIFGGTAACADVAAASGLFERVFSGERAAEESVAYLRGGPVDLQAGMHAHTLIERISRKHPVPVLRHHFGLPSLAATIEGARKIADAGVLDVLSIGPDQCAQEHFFRPGEMRESDTGAGGVPLRKADDLRAIHDATRTGNFPLLRCYSGTRDLILWAEMNHATIGNAWAAIPLCWYSELDGRSAVPIRHAIREKQRAMRWHAQRGLPVEVNESHQWGLRDAHDALVVAMAFLAAYNAKRAGVRWYVAQLMLNTPPGTSQANDLAKMTAVLAMLSRLEDDSFVVLREIRPGIAHFSTDPHVAKGQGAAAIAYGMLLRPHIVHAVSHSEGDHATTADELIESCSIALGAIRTAQVDGLDPRNDPRVLARRDALIRDADCILEALRTSCGGSAGDPWTDPSVIATAVETGVLDTPHFQGHPRLCGTIVTRCIDGAWHPVDPVTGRIIPEQERLASIVSARRVRHAATDDASVGSRIHAGA